MPRYDAVIVGAGPNGLAAGIALAEAGRSVLIREARERVGGGASSDELTLPGFVHDTFSTVHPLGVGSPFLSRLPLHEHGLEWVHSEAAFAHPFDDGTAALLERSIEQTGRWLAEDAGRLSRRTDVPGNGFGTKRACQPIASAKQFPPAIDG